MSQRELIVKLVNLVGAHESFTVDDIFIQGVGVFSNKHVIQSFMSSLTRADYVKPLDWIKQAHSSRKVRTYIRVRDIPEDFKGVYGRVKKSESKEKKEDYSSYEIGEAVIKAYKKLEGENFKLKDSLEEARMELRKTKLALKQENERLKRKVEELEDLIRRKVSTFPANELNLDSRLCPKIG